MPSNLPLHTSQIVLPALNEPADPMRPLLLMLALQSSGGRLTPMMVVLLARYGASQAELSRLQRTLEAIQGAMNEPQTFAKRTEAIKSALTKYAAGTPTPK